MRRSNSDEESHSLRGPLDRTALRMFCDEFETLEPLATGTLVGTIDSVELRIVFDDGIGRAEGGRFDVRWSAVGDYNIHYTDDLDRDLRWDVHPHSFPDPDGDEHFHPPPDASSDPDDVQGSCITVSEIVLVARATAKLWRYGYERESLAIVNEFVDPP